MVNDTRVIPARLLGVRETGGQCEVLLVKPLGDGRWEAMARPGRKMREGTKVYFSDRFSCEVLETLSSGTKVVSFVCDGDLMEAVNEHGHMPLPLYIKRRTVWRTASAIKPFIPRLQVPPQLLRQVCILRRIYWRSLPVRVWIAPLLHCMLV